MRNILGLVAIAGIAATCSARPVFQEAFGQSKSTVSMQSSDGKDSYELRIQDGKVTAKVNGEEVPADRVVRTKNGDHETVEIRDENGNVVKTFELNTGGINLAPLARIGTLRSATAPKVARGGFRAVEPAEAVEGVAAPEMDNPPPVMVGVTMVEPEQSVLEFLKLEKGVVFDRVIDDLPAAKAGIKVGDILVEVKGEKNIGMERFREILRGLKAGDKLDMKVARAGGEIHPVTLSLVAFDAKALGREKQAESDGTWDVVSHQGAHKYWEEAQKAVEKAMKELKDNPNLQSDAVKKSMEESLAKAMESLKQAKDSLRDVQIFSNNGQWSPQATTRFRLKPGQNGAVVVPPNFTPEVPDVDDGRIQKLEKKVDDLNKKLDKIAKMLEDRK